MIDADIEKLLHRPSDRRLDTLEADIWAGVAERERSVRISRGLFAMQAVVLALTLLGALVAGKYTASAAGPAVDVFSPRMALSASTLLDGSER